MIALYNVQKSYRGRCVLNLPAMEFAEGGRYALVGPNGAGKSTLLRILAGTLSPDAGEIRIPQEFSRDCGYLPQIPYGFGFSVLKNVEIALPESANRQQQAESALDIVGMTPLLHARGSTLSGGETQRMAFARMIAKPRKLLLLDEPTAAMDVAGSDRIERALLEYCAEHGSTLIFSTHSLAQAQRIADEVLMLSNGTLVERGIPRQVLFAPQSEQAKAFLRYWALERKD